MPEILIIGESEIIEGFGLTGAGIEPIRDPARVQWLIGELLRSKNTDIVVVTESLYEQIPEKVQSRAEASGRPLFVTLPRPSGGEGWADRENLISRIIRRTIGYRVKISR